MPPARSSRRSGPPLRESIARDVRQRIVSGELAPGERLGEERLAGEYEVSRVPVREALHSLEQLGFVDIVPRRGATVAFPSARRTREQMVVREALEALTASLAAQRRGGEVAEELVEVVRRGEAATVAGSYAELPALIDRFHDLVGEASGNMELARLSATVRAQVRWIYEMDLELRSEKSWEQHRAIAEAILGGDAEAAESAMRRDVTRDAALLLDVLMARAETGHRLRT